MMGLILRSAMTWVTINVLIQPFLSSITFFLLTSNTMPFCRVVVILNRTKPSSQSQKGTTCLSWQHISTNSQSYTKHADRFSMISKNFLSLSSKMQYYPFILLTLEHQ